MRKRPDAFLFKQGGLQGDGSPTPSQRPEQFWALANVMFAQLVLPTLGATTAVTVAAAATMAARYLRP